MDKSFDALYAVCMAMADNCIKAQDLNSRFGKLDEEYEELKKEISDLTLNPNSTSFNKNVVGFDEITDELADVTFVLLHTAHKMGLTPFDLLHKASSKMLSRMNDSNYIAKEDLKAA